MNEPSYTASHQDGGGVGGSRIVQEFYESHPYPPPVDDVVAYGKICDDRRRRAESHLFWPTQRYRDDRSILVAGCGTTQALHYALRWPNAHVVGIDFSAQSIDFTRRLKDKYALDNLEVRQIALENVAELGRSFEYIVCTGVLHHTFDPDAALRALREVLDVSGALNLMVYAPYGRAGIYMLQEYCRRLNLGWTSSDVRDLAASLKALSQDHPIAALLRTSPDFADTAGLADALLHPQDRSYSVPQLFDLLDRAGLHFGRWVRQAPYLSSCGAIASIPHQSRLAALSVQEEYAALELFRGTMVRHGIIAYKTDGLAYVPIDRDGDEWLHLIPTRLPDTVVVKERVPAGSTAVLINRNHSYTDLYFAIDAHRERLFEAIDGESTIEQICRTHGDRSLARAFFRQLWQWDQIVFALEGQRL